MMIIVLILTRLLITYISSIAKEDDASLGSERWQKHTSADTHTAKHNGVTCSKYIKWQTSLISDVVVFSQ